MEDDLCVDCEKNVRPVNLCSYQLLVRLTNIDDEDYHHRLNTRCVTASPPI